MNLRTTHSRHDSRIPGHANIAFFHLRERSACCPIRRDQLYRFRVRAWHFGKTFAMHSFPAGLLCAAGIGVEFPPQQAEIHVLLQPGISHLTHHLVRDLLKSHRVTTSADLHWGGRLIGMHSPKRPHMTMRFPHCHSILRAESDPQDSCFRIKVAESPSAYCLPKSSTK